ncbi:hypothetical protein GLOIN_2v1777513 [Rhizophagus clarus]|uniref:Uncharacterized protein n=1 Tax=Rhizophagus clarus TaxID=94130 RepID=A0A8H3M9T0_9GLOM|nr:hypothetical protein GLOIN_2v1777513 [Rhizophagus clarus]
MKQVLGSYGGHNIVSYRKDMKEYLINSINRGISANFHILQTFTHCTINGNHQNNANSKILSVINGTLEFVKYFNEYWIENIKLRWTYYDKLIAANILNVSIDSIPNTNNYLKAFNNQLKIHHLNRFQNRGHLLRLDILSVLLIKSITSNLLLCIDFRKKLNVTLDTKFIQYTSKSRKPDQNLQNINQLAYFTPDKLRDQKAKIIVQEKQIINIEYTKDSLLLWIKSNGAYKHIRAAIIWINWLQSQPSQNTYYSNLQYSQLPLITLPSHEEAFNSFNKNQTQELLLFKQELQEVYTDSISFINSNNNMIMDNIISINEDSPTETIVPSTTAEATIFLTETTTSTETTAPFTTPFTPLNLNTKYSISIWKQEYISSISNLLADLNDLITVENSMNRLT